MTEQIHTDWATERPRSNMRSLWRLVIWGTLAGVSVFVAIISAYSGTGHRASAAVAPSQPVGPQASEQETAQQRVALADLRAQSMSNAAETRRLSEAVRTLAADRDQLASRVAGLERGYDNITGSVKRPSGAPLAAQANPPAMNAAPAGRPEAPMTTGSTTGVVSTNSVASGSAAPMPAASASGVSMAAAQPGMPSGRGEEAKSSEAAKGAAVADAARSPAAEPLPPSGLGVDVGGAPNFEGLRALWHTTKNNDPSLLDDFYPAVATRENSKTHAPELRLIIGPMPDAEAAAQLCVTLAAAHQYCQPVAFEGQRLAIADSGKGGSPRHRAPATQPVAGQKVVPAYPTGK